MTREEVKNAGSKHAQDMYCSGDNPTPRYRIAQIHASRDGFVAGAEWRINSVWHEASEMPEHKFALVEYDCFPKGHGYVVVPDPREVIKAITRWAYIEDLLPIKED